MHWLFAWPKYGQNPCLPIRQTVIFNKQITTKPISLVEQTKHKILKYIDHTFNSSIKANHIVQFVHLRFAAFKIRAIALFPSVTVRALDKRELPSFLRLLFSVIF